MAVYPRVCGGTHAGTPARAGSEGLSPRVRGNHAVPLDGNPLNGSIPACAGEPAKNSPTGRPGRVYPRVCGGTRHLDPVAQHHRGLSPRVRGNPWLPIRRRRRRRSIPACAGEPLERRCDDTQYTVYPRVCGGTGPDDFSEGAYSGLSPRVRGNPAVGGGYVGPFGSIPRVCGGTRGLDVSITLHGGLSPRVRGNPVGTTTSNHVGRSIPACAGEPPTAGGKTTSAKVYPRVCGGTTSGRPNRGRGFRSIPACAGEPLSRRQPPAASRVYPRVCGGTQPQVAVDSHVAGLSPRVRGNRNPQLIQIFHQRSIPACAGEPPTGLARGPSPGVYPRVCGGTGFLRPCLFLQCGLSPRVRGNRFESVGGQCIFTVYPRVCGGTSSARVCPREGRGLSPRVRGNPYSARGSAGK